MIKIEFFHDIICSFCFPMSARMRKIAKRHNNLEIIHRSFALGWEEEDFIRGFGSRKAVKSVVLSHWDQANANDNDHRFNIEGMRKADFDFPLSQQALIAAKAAGIVGGEGMYWEVFDRIQNKLFVENKNVEELSVLEEAVKESSISFEEWKSQFEKKETKLAVLDDFRIARDYGIHSVPTLVINEKHIVSGAQSEEYIEKILAEVSNEEGVPLNISDANEAENSGGSCSFDGDKWNCN